MSLSTKLGKPSSEVARELGELFPSCSPGPSTSKRGADFDPHQELPGVPDRKRKKKAITSSGRCVNVTVCRLPNYTPFVPKGKLRSNLREKGRLQTYSETRQVCSVCLSFERRVNTFFTYRKLVLAVNVIWIIT